MGRYDTEPFFVENDLTGEGFFRTMIQSLPKARQIINKIQPAMDAQFKDNNSYNYLKNKISPLNNTLKILGI